MADPAVSTIECHVQIPSMIQMHVTLADKNWFQTGGCAQYFCEPTTTVEFQQALLFADQNKLPLCILGSGANVLISDTGFNGLVIRPALTSYSSIDISDTQILVNAGAGLTMDALIEYCLNNGIIGLEEFSGIPGTIGGSVYINLHYFEYLLSQFLDSAVVINANTGVIEHVTTGWFEFGYNASKLQDRSHYLLEATFKLRRVAPLEIAYARGRRAEIMRHRAARYPRSATCGSFFRNFFDHEVTVSIGGKPMTFVAYYLDKIGIKGSLAVGGARVSHQHANMIVNTGAATSHDIVELARCMQTMVQQTFGIIPQPECILIGFQNHPLL